jgi:crotonobetainyl-CoA:carnitine CoA-transferase CaiB-like acyl-CoA transferase
MGGLLSITGERDDRPGGGPQRSGLPGIDLMTGVYSAVAILAALRHRDASGLGQHLDLSLLDVQVSSLAYLGVDYLASGNVPRRTGNTNPVSHPSGVYAGEDGQLCLLVGNDKQFASFCTAIGMPRLELDPRFSSPALRVANSQALDDLIKPALLKAPVSFWVKTMEGVGVPCGPINDVAAVLADPHVKARGAASSVRHSELGEIPILCSPIRMSATPARYRSAPPVLGEHTSEILETVVGLSEQEIEKLSSNHIV